MQRKTSNLLPILIVLALIGVIAYAVSTQLTINNNGTVVTSLNLTAYEEPASINPVTSIAWSPLMNGANTTEIVYLNSTSNVPTTLTLTTTAWLPTQAETYIDLTWDLEGSTINPGEILEATFTLTVSPSTQNITAFSFTTIIDAEEVP